MQRAAGNQATTELISRAAADASATPVGPEGPDPEHLSSEALAGDDFDAAYHNRPPLRRA